MNRTELNREEMLEAWRRRDRDYDSLFVIAVKTTGIFCRPSCPSKPRADHLEFFSTATEAIRAGYRPCKRCGPERASGRPPDWVSQLMTLAGESPDRRISAPEMRAMGVTPERARRWFQRHHGMTFAAWCRGLRMGRAFMRLRRGEPMDDVILGHGFESHSGFRSAFGRVFGRAPGQAAREGAVLRSGWVETPLGPMLAVVDEEAVCQLEFADRGRLDLFRERVRRRFGLPVIPGEHPLLRQLQVELNDYFAGQRRDFNIRVKWAGTPFQVRVWQELQRVPYGATESYSTIARNIGQPSAVRAVARTNAMNPVYLVVPCHRIIGRDGAIRGYGGGVWRKRWLLELERAQKPAAVPHRSEVN